MKHEIDCYFDPDIAWLGEINRQVLRLEREVSVFSPQQTHLNCALRPGGERPAGVTLTLDVGDKRLRSFAESPSPARASTARGEGVRCRNSIGSRCRSGWRSWSVTRERAEQTGTSEGVVADGGSVTECVMRNSRVPVLARH